MKVLFDLGWPRGHLRFHLEIQSDTQFVVIFTPNNQAHTAPADNNAVEEYLCAGYQSQKAFDYAKADNCDT
ncbi:hypothetical protein [Pedobacter terrae]|uniref:hypothetical protein n=1 Tax=Pedobacter terrae TaxID=405671 RepID=UPI000B860BEC|nr:hypothetical protein [Pedobacter terrae]